MMPGPQQFPLAGGRCPEGYDLVHRSAVVRLGVGGPILHTDTNHASLGVTSIAEEDNYLVVNTDFDVDELILSATANVDLTLAKKGIFVGASGGSACTKFGIYSTKTLKTYAPYTLLGPQSSVFDSAVDNLWINFLSLRRLEAAQ